MIAALCFKKQCCFSSMSSIFFYDGQYIPAGGIARQIELLLYYQECGYTSRIKFSTKIMLDKESNIVKQLLRYNIIQWKNQGSFDSLNDITNHVTLL